MNGGRVRDAIASLRDTLLRVFPHRSRTGLFPVGRPGPDSPVVLTGNYALTVRRVRRALRGTNAWLLVADSRGINVWCAAGGGHLTHHDVITAIRSSGVERAVTHRRLLLPPLAATGVERREVTHATGWTVTWGPVRAADLPRVIRRGLRVHTGERRVRFPPSERLEMAALWAGPMTAVAGPVAGLAGGWPVGVCVAVVVPILVGSLFLLCDRVPVRGRRSVLTYAGAAAAGALAGLAGLAPFGLAGPRAALTLSGVLLAAMAVLALDLPGTTPLFPSTINTFGNRFEVELIENRCRGIGDCVVVCPRGVLAFARGERRAAIRHPERCLLCGACVVQCPSDALRFRFPDGRVVPPGQVRRTRMNMLGRRTPTPA